MQAEMARHSVGLPSTIPPAAAMREWDGFGVRARERMDEEKHEDEDEASDVKEDVRASLRTPIARGAVSHDSDLGKHSTDYFSAQPTKQWRSSGHSEGFSTPYGTTPGSHCICAEGCRCRDACRYDIHLCRCKAAQSQPKLYSVQPPYYENVEPPSDTWTSPISHPSFASMSNSMARLHIARPTSGEPQVPRMAHGPHLTGSIAAPKVRQRSNTAKSDLVYVPDAPTPPAMSATKDAYPLDFYGRNSGQRFPKFHRSDAGQLSPTDGPASRNNASRKAVTSPLAADPGLVHADDVEGQSRNPVPPIRMRRHVRNIDISNPPIPDPNSTSYAQSFPLASQGNPRGIENEFGDWDTSHIKTPVLKPLGQGGGVTDRVAHVRHSADSTASAFQRQRDIEGTTEYGKAIAPPPLALRPPLTLSMPDFIAPRPASRQRYVQAGGNARLEDRPEISNFALPPALDQGLSLTKEELEQRLLEMSPPRRDSAFSSARPSQDSVSSPPGGRVSRDLEEDAFRGKRSRTSSSVSSKIKRMFSRQHSSTE
ncbi:hypothetical protein DOTSEDRAFT_76866 [Dothistroma septosporum NZE10]|uniref:Uncharacterized protein n=1 Tax=Dothistroma septosporum (strain NZE10 / CBS 128990) TaxID=675120 RepID=N1Q4P6_DOTSN|nr:hypothetical protein DOTSEDRAFT_76866 [Dothistroma septosporum NZE10]